ncbi:hypothetical protein F8M41_002657 [Gigaspora margarita]|uniref:HMG box domain-containing protein n=1 Tax=Gigaspora margarita TaxID=4874 RepID=A0A8H3XDY8_GIGMA|nr:hypothetical protein F8M41_002657 [Gigaspora margarita]
MAKQKAPRKSKPSLGNKPNPNITVVDIKFPPTSLKVESFVQKKKSRVLKFPNAFVFFRSVYNQTLREKGIKLSQSDVSASASFVWKNKLSTEVKNFYFEFASNVRKQYLMKHPVSYYKCEFEPDSKSMVTSKDEPKKLKTFNFIYENQNPKIVKQPILQEEPQSVKVIPSQLDNVINPPTNMISWSNEILRGQPTLFNNERLDNISHENPVLWTGSSLFSREYDQQFDAFNLDHLFISDNERQQQFIEFNNIFYAINNNDNTYFESE